MMENLLLYFSLPLFLDLHFLIINRRVLLQLVSRLPQLHDGPRYIPDVEQRIVSRGIRLDEEIC